MIHKAFVILDTLSKHKFSTIDALSELSDIPRSTVHRILKILQEEGAVTHESGRGYVLTPMLLSMTMRGIAERDMLDVAIPIMRLVSENTQETVSINVISGDERVCIYRIEGTQPITRSIRIGSRAPLFRGSAGKVLASSLTSWERDRILDIYLADGRFAQQKVPALLKELEMVARQGYSVSIGERIEGSASIAVPVRDAMDRIVGSLSLATIRDRMTSENRKQFLSQLMEASARIHQLLSIGDI